MTRDEFCDIHWDYYLVLEKDFLEVERYVAFALGDDYLYDGHAPSSPENSGCFSNEFVKQYQAICSEVDVILKSICTEVSNQSSANTMKTYSEEVLVKWPDLAARKVKFKRIELQPFMNWKKGANYHAPDWWPLYNDVKHKRMENYKKANLKNTLNALAGLYLLEIYLVKFIGDRDSVPDVPNDISKLFEAIDFHTKDTVIGKEEYLMNDDDMAEIEAILDQ